MQDLAVSIQIADEGGDATLEVEGQLAVAALVQKVNGGAARDEGHLAETLDEGVETVFERFGEDKRVILKGGLGAGICGLDLPDDLDRFLGVAAYVALEVHMAIAFDFHLAPFGKRIHRGNTHPVQPARDLITAAAELAAGVQLGHHHFQG